MLTIQNYVRAGSLEEAYALCQKKNNVVLGGMSLVGPRPIVSGEIEKYGEVYDEYCRVKPGITGLWQISGRNDTSYEERVAYDHYYINNWSVWMDLWILGRTVPAMALIEFPADGFAPSAPVPPAARIPV